MKEYKSRKNRRKYSRMLTQRREEERIMDMEEGIYFELDNDHSQRKKGKSKEKKIQELHYNVECFISGSRSNDMVCCNCSEARKVERLYNVRMVKKEPVNTKYGLFMFQIIL